MMELNISEKLSNFINHSQNIVSHLYSSLIGFVFPPQCVVCERLHENNNYFICQHCQHSLVKFNASVCPKCRARMDFGENRCLVCQTRSPISKVVAVGEFDDLFRPLIHAYKYHGIVPIGNFLGDLLSGQFHEFDNAESYDLIIPIPLHHSRERKRGFNQSLIIANRLGHNLRIDCHPDKLLRIKKTRTQTGLSRPERLKNIRDAFALSGEFRFDGLRIILVDDVTTTGATAVEAAKILKQAGAKKIVLGVIASAGPDEIN